MLKKIKNLIAAPIVRVFKYKKLQKNSFFVTFIHEGNVKILLPKLSMGELIFGYGIYAKKSLYFMGRPYVEILLRRIIFDLYKESYIDSNNSIIDIGSSVADNSLVWSKNLTENGKIFGIDPSMDNINYSKKLSYINKIDNIDWIQAVCSEKKGDRLIININPSKDAENTSFKIGNSINSLAATTLDEIIREKKNTKIGLIHIDVEGFELKVMKGAKKIIEHDKPVLTFEQHISKEDTGHVFKFLKNFGYRIFMINEVIPGNELDCRNFLAFHSSKELPNFSNFDENKLKKLNICQATIGSGLIEF
jgi:FkbM family methyltransferase